MKLLAHNPRPDPHRAFTTVNHKTYEEMMAPARDAWQWALVAVAILEEQMERMSHSTSCQCSTSTPAATDAGGPDPQDGKKIPK